MIPSLCVSIMGIQSSVQEKVGDMVKIGGVPYSFSCWWEQIMSANSLGSPSRECKIVESNNIERWMRSPPESSKRKAHAQ